MARVRLIHWKAEEAAPLLSALRAAGHQVDYEAKPGYHVAMAVRAEQPAAVVIDLSRMPSHGREIGMYLRRSKATRQIPLVYVGGEPEKVAAIRQKLPDAVYTSSARLSGSLRKALSAAPKNPLVPPPIMQQYKGRTTAQKLGIKEGNSIAVIDPPRDYVAVLGAMPEGVSLLEESPRACDLTLWFVQDVSGYQSELPRLKKRAAGGKLWILWRKQSAGKKSNLTLPQIRETAMQVGLVDYKICSLNEIWSGMLFTKKSAQS